MPPVHLPGNSWGDLSKWGVDEAQVQAVLLTKQAVELRRVLDEHRQLIESIQETPGPTPTLTVREMQEVAVARVVAHPEGVPLPPEVDQNWFNPKLGLTFYRE